MCRESRYRDESACDEVGRKVSAVIKEHLQE